jgi:putative transposase
MIKVIQAYRYAVEPTAAQQAALRSHCGAQRFAFNWGLELVRANLAQRAAEVSYGVDVDALAPALPWSAYAMRKLWNRVKGTVAPWWPENSKEAYSSGLANLAYALKNWNDSKSGMRRGRNVQFPRFKGKREKLSCRFTTGAFGLTTDRRHLKLPRIGIVRTYESTRKLARRVEQGTARILSATAGYQAGRWFVSFTVEVERNQPAHASSTAVIGVDLGVKSLAVLSTGEVIANPRHLEVALRELRRLQRAASRRIGPDRRIGRRPSNRWCRTQVRIAKLHTAVANARRDGLHKLTTRLTRSAGTLVIEDLHVAGMLKNRRLARRIAGVGMGELRRQLTYKSTWCNAGLLVADRWYPSSKTCSDCGAVKAKLRLSDRTYVCEHCGLSIDRDLNAAINLASLVASISNSSSSPSCGATRNGPTETPSDLPCAGRSTAAGRPGSIRVNAAL